MEELLPFYERELAFLRRYSREFSERYPKIAGRLLLSGDVSEDPHVERLIESFALLNARVSKKIEDDYPQFTDALLEVLYPHYLRPFPACSIARLGIGRAAGQLTRASIIPRGTELRSQPVRGVSCRFRTAYDVTVGPLSLGGARYDPLAQAPRNVRLSSDATGRITLDLELTSDQATLASLDWSTVRLFIDGEPSFCAALRDALSIHAAAAFVEAADDRRWRPLSAVPVQMAGFADDEALIDYPQQSHPAFRLLTEFFAYPEKFNFIDIDLQALIRQLPPATRRFRLHVVLSRVRSDSTMARTLENLSRDSLRMGCTPVVNLFQQRGEPIRVSGTRTSYPVVADARRAYGYEVYSVDAVKHVRQTAQGETVTDFKPFYSLKHDEPAEHANQYWVTERDELIAETSPGYELQMTLVDADFDPVQPHTDTLSVELTCTNRDLPALLAHGRPGGDFTLEGGTLIQTVEALRKPSVPRRFKRGRSAHWRLISHLSLDHLSLLQGGVEALKEILRVYDLPRSAISARQIAGVVGLSHQPATAWLPRGKYSAMVRGLEITLTIDEESFVGSGIDVFAQVVDRFFGFYVHANSFTQLILVSEKTTEEILRCPPRSGDIALV